MLIHWGPHLGHQAACQVQYCGRAREWGVASSCGSRFATFVGFTCLWYTITLKNTRIPHCTGALFSDSVFSCTEGIVCILHKRQPPPLPLPLRHKHCTDTSKGLVPGKCVTAAMVTHTGARSCCQVVPIVACWQVCHGCCQSCMLQSQLSRKTMQFAGLHGSARARICHGTTMSAAVSLVTRRLDVGNSDDIFAEHSECPPSNALASYATSARGSLRTLSQRLPSRNCCNR
jgi:hypothetical protein